MTGNEYGLVNKMMPNIKTYFSDKRNLRAALKHIQIYTDKQADIWLTNDFSKRPLFNEGEKQWLIHEVGLTKADVEKAIKESDDIVDTWKIGTQYFAIFMTVVIKYFNDKKMYDERDIFATYLGLQRYISAHCILWQYLPNPATVEPTLAKLNNQFMLKQLGTIFAMIEKTIVVTFNTYEPRLNDGSDLYIKDFVYAIDKRIKDKVQNIHSVWKEVHQDKKFVFKSTESDDEEQLRKTPDSVTHQVELAAGATVRHLLTGGGASKKAISDVSKICGTSESKLTTVMQSIVKNADAQEIFIVAECIITLYTQNTKKNIKPLRLSTMEFLGVATRLYKSNSQDVLTLKMKNILSDWLDSASIKYGGNFIPRGKSSLDAYRRAMFMCMTFSIMEANKRRRD